ncbi:MAG: hypothetical protein ACXVCD_19735 [Pseudobdellovibrionaceae bacterium]
MTVPKICGVVGKSRSIVEVSIRTIRNSGVSQMNLTDSEKKSIETAIKEEIEKLLREQKNFKLSRVSDED